jgi:TetR/AcrR family transcriptional repressor of nem operon
MRYPPDQKRQTYERILSAAAGLFRKRGYAATGLDAIMASVNLTAGAFYAHFRSKESLLAEALDTAFRQSSSDRPGRLKDLHGREWVRKFTSFYLSSDHRDNPEQGCPMPALAPEIARIGGPSRAAFERHLRGLFEKVGQELEPAGRHRPFAAVALCVGGIMLARAVDDPALSEQILSDCRAAFAEDGVIH